MEWKLLRWQLYPQWRWKVWYSYPNPLKECRGDVCWHDYYSGWGPIQLHWRSYDPEELL